jgi:hypothetical protein
MKEMLSRTERLGVERRVISDQLTIKLYLYLISLSGRLNGKGNPLRNTFETGKQPSGCGMAQHNISEERNNTINY